MALALLGAAIVTDSLRPPARQFMAQAYVAAARRYQRIVSPMLTSTVRCRYRPTCSQYSIEAVQRFGIGRGLLLTWRRIHSCQRTVPFGTVNEVPAL